MQSEDTQAMKLHASKFKDEACARRKKELTEDEKWEETIAEDLKHMDLRHQKEKYPPVKLHVKT